MNRALWEKAMDMSAVAGVPPPSQEASFHWKHRAEGVDGIVGDIYSDASRLDGNRVGRAGWAFAVVQPGTAEVVAAASGVPPRWVESVPKSEAWALMMAVRVAEFIGSTATIDCLSVLQTLRGGVKRATHHGKEGARLWNMVFPYFDGGSADDSVRWMPAHKGSDQASHLRDSRGNPLTEHDVTVNALVDKLAKEAVEEHRVPRNIRQAVAQRAKNIRQVAFSIGLAAREANEVEGGGDATL